MKKTHLIDNSTAILGKAQRMEPTGQVAVLETLHYLTVFYLISTNSNKRRIYVITT